MEKGAKAFTSSLTLHAVKPNFGSLNALLHFDFLNIGPGAGGNTYVLVMKDDLLSYVMLVAANVADAITTANVLIHCTIGNGFQSSLWY